MQGKLCWAKFRGLPFWPARIDGPGDDGDSSSGGGEGHTDDPADTVDDVKADGASGQLLRVTLFALDGLVPATTVWCNAALVLPWRKKESSSSAAAPSAGTPTNAGGAGATPTSLLTTPTAGVTVPNPNPFLPNDTALLIAAVDAAKAWKRSKSSSSSSSSGGGKKKRGADLFRDLSSFQSRKRAKVDAEGDHDAAPTEGLSAAERLQVRCSSQ